MSRVARDGRNCAVSIRITPALKAELEAEAWECERSLSDYVAGLLTRRGKWYRSTSTATGPAAPYDLQCIPGQMPKEDPK